MESAMIGTHGWIVTGLLAALWLFPAATNTQAGIWDKGARIALEAAGSRLGLTLEETVKLFVANPESRRTIISTIEKLGHADKAPRLMQPNASTLLTEDILSWRSDALAKCSAYGAGATGADGVIEQKFRPELGVSVTSGCLGWKALRSNSATDPEVIQRFLNSAK
jgi:hypothetical protein